MPKESRVLRNIFISKYSIQGAYKKVDLNLNYINRLHLKHLIPSNIFLWLIAGILMIRDIMSWLTPWHIAYTRFVNNLFGQFPGQTIPQLDAIKGNA